MTAFAVWHVRGPVKRGFSRALKPANTYMATWRDGGRYVRSFASDWAQKLLLARRGTVYRSFTKRKESLIKRKNFFMNWSRVVDLGT